MDVQAKRAIVANGKPLEVDSNATFRAVATTLGVAKIAAPGAGRGPELHARRTHPRRRQGSRDPDQGSRRPRGCLRHSASHLMASAIKRVVPRGALRHGAEHREGVLLRRRDLEHRLDDDDLQEDRSRDAEDRRRGRRSSAARPRPRTTPSRSSTAWRKFKHELILRPRRRGGEGLLLLLRTANTRTTARGHTSPRPAGSSHQADRCLRELLARQGRQPPAPARARDGVLLRQGN